MTTSRFQRSVIGALSILIVFFATCANQQVISFHNGDDVVAVEGLPGSDQGDQKDTPQKEYKIRAYEAVLPIVQATFSSLQCFFFETQPITEDFTEDERVFDLPFISYFNTLFRRIISPNAP